MIKLLFLMLCLSPLHSAAEKTQYPANTIPSELRENVNAVVRDDKTIYKILSKSQAKLYIHYAVTIFNSKGDKFSVFHLDYDKLTKLLILSANIYDANGKLVRKIKA